MSDTVVVLYLNINHSNHLKILCSEMMKSFITLTSHNSEKEKNPNVYNTNSASLVKGTLSKKKGIIFRSLF